MYMHFTYYTFQTIFYGNNIVYCCLLLRSALLSQIYVTPANENCTFIKSTIIIWIKQVLSNISQ